MMQTLVDSYLQYCRLKAKVNPAGIDLKSCTFLHPSAIAPLYFFSKKTNQRLILPNNECGKYIQYITGQTSQTPKFNNHVQLTELPQHLDHRNFILQNIDIVCRNGEFIGGGNAYNFIISELTCNIYEHALCDKAIVMAQSFSSHGFTEIVILDDGQTIPVSLSNAGFQCKDDLDAIKQAVQGRSAKSDERGYGLGNSIQLIEKLEGQILLVSGLGALYHSPSDKNVYKLNQTTRYEGTYIAIRLRHSKEDLGGAFYDIINRGYSNNLT